MAERPGPPPAVTGADAQGVQILNPNMPAQPPIAPMTPEQHAGLAAALGNGRQGENRSRTGSRTETRAGSNSFDTLGNDPQFVATMKDALANNEAADRLAEPGYLKDLLQLPDNYTDADLRQAQRNIINLTNNNPELAAVGQNDNTPGQRGHAINRFTQGLGGLRQRLNEPSSPATARTGVEQPPAARPEQPQPAAGRSDSAVVRPLQPLNRVNYDPSDVPVRASYPDRGARTNTNRQGENQPTGPGADAVEPTLPVVPSSREQSAEQAQPTVERIQTFENGELPREALDAMAKAVVDREKLEEDYINKKNTSKILEEKPPWWRIDVHARKGIAKLADPVARRMDKIQIGDKKVFEWKESKHAKRIVGLGKVVFGAGLTGAMLFAPLGMGTGALYGAGRKNMDMGITEIFQSFNKDYQKNISEMNQQKTLLQENKGEYQRLKEGEQTPEAIQKMAELVSRYEDSSKKLMELRMGEKGLHNKEVAFRERAETIASLTTLSTTLLFGLPGAKLVGEGYTRVAKKAGQEVAKVALDSDGHRSWANGVGTMFKNWNFNLVDFLYNNPTEYAGAEKFADDYSKAFKVGKETIYNPHNPIFNLFGKMTGHALQNGALHAAQTWGSFLIGTGLSGRLGHFSKLKPEQRSPGRAISSGYPANLGGLSNFEGHAPTGRSVRGAPGAGELAGPRRQPPQVEGNRFGGEDDMGVTGVRNQPVQIEAGRRPPAVEGNQFGGADQASESTQRPEHESGEVLEVRRAAVEGWLANQREGIFPVHAFIHNGEFRMTAEDNALPDNGVVAVETDNQVLADIIRARAENRHNRYETRLHGLHAEIRPDSDGVDRVVIVADQRPQRRTEMPMPGSQRESNEPPETRRSPAELIASIREARERQDREAAANEEGDREETSPFPTRQEQEAGPERYLHQPINIKITKDNSQKGYKLTATLPGVGETSFVDIINGNEQTEDLLNTIREADEGASEETQMRLAEVTEHSLFGRTVKRLVVEPIT